MAEPSTRERSLALVVDDEQTGRLILKSQLEREDYRVVTAATGQEAIDAFAREQPDIIFLDVMLPDLYGYDVARAIKAAAGERFVPIIFLTGLTEVEALAQCVEAGGDDFLSKPIKFAVLKAKIAAIERIRDLYERVRMQHAELNGLHDRMQYEQDIAERIFTGAVMARNIAEPPIQTWLKAASTFNGDLFISAYTPTGGLSVLFGDFTGHGLAAAIGALPTSETFRSMTAKGFSLQEVLAEINRKLNRLLPTGMFLAAAALRIESDLSSALAWNSGLPDLMLCRHGAARQVIESCHPPLGALREFLPNCVPQLISLQPDDVFILCSDGVPESINNQGEAFGEARYYAILDACKPQAAFAEVQSQLCAFVGDAVQQDDISLVAIPCSPALFEGFAKATQQANARPLPQHAWHWDLRLEGQHLRQIDPAPLIVHQLKALGISEQHQQQLYVVVTELFSNALEHGVLNLNSSQKNSAAGFMAYYQQRQDLLDQLQDGFVRIAVDYRWANAEGIITVRVQDSGQGFSSPDTDVDAIGANPSEGNTPAVSTAHSKCGRGIELLRTLCRRVRYLGIGNEVEVEYLL